MADPAEERPSGGFSGALSQLAASVLALLHTRLELFTTELEEQRERVKHLLVLAVAAAVFLSFAIIVLSALVLALFWHTYPLTAILCVALLYAALGAGALIGLRRLTRARPFDATISELEHDVEWLRRKR